MLTWHVSSDECAVCAVRTLAPLLLISQRSFEGGPITNLLFPDQDVETQEVAYLAQGYVPSDWQS